MAAQIIRRPVRAAQQQAQMYYARKRVKARAEATAGRGGLRAQRGQFGIRVSVVLTVGGS